MSENKDNTAIKENPTEEIALNTDKKEEKREIDFIVNEVDTVDIFHEENSQDFPIKPQIPKFQKISRIVILSSLLVLTLAIGTLFFWEINNQREEGVSIPEMIAQTFAASEESFAFPEYISVNGVQLGGLTLDEAVQSVTESQNSLLRKFTYKITAHGKTVSVSQDNFYYIFNTEDIVRDAKTYVENNPQNTEAKNFEIAYVIDTDKITSVLSEAVKPLENSAVNPTITGFSGDKLLFSEGKAGYAVDRNTLYSSFDEFYASQSEYGEITLNVTVQNPSYTVEELSSKIKLISKYSTVSTNNANGNANMKRAMEACNGSVIEPGQVWSFNTRTGNSNLTSNGYLPATVITGGTLDTGIGGGICQASTTIYDAALYAGLEIAERHCHYWAAKYANPGFDSTIDYPRLDLKIKNNTSYPVYLYCEMVGTKLTARIFGAESTSYDRIVLSDSFSKKSGEFFFVDSYRSFYKNGSLINKEYLGSSKYNGTYKGDLFVMYNEATESAPVTPTPTPTPDTSSSETSTSSTASQTSSDISSSDISSGTSSTASSDTSSNTSSTDVLSGETSHNN